MEGSDFDTSKIGLIAAEAMEIFEREFADRDAVITEAAIVFEVRYTDEDGDTVIETPICCTNDSRVYQTGLFDWAHALAKENAVPAEREDDHDDD